MALMDDFDPADWFDDDGNPRDAAEYAEFFGIVMNMLTTGPDQKSDEDFLRGILPKLRAAGKHAHAKSLIDEYVKKHAQPLPPEYFDEQDTDDEGGD